MRPQRFDRRPNRTTLALLAAACVGTLMLGGCTATKTEEAKSGEMSAAVSAVTGSFKLDARTDLDPAGGFDRLFVTESHVIAYTPTNQAFRLSRDLGIQQIRRVTTEDDRLYPPLQLGDRIVYPTNITLEIYKPDGNIEKQVRVPHAVTSRATVDQRGLILIGTASPTGGRLTMIDPRESVLQVYQETLLGTIISAPASFQGTVFAATDGGKVFAVGEDNVSVWVFGDEFGFKVDRPVRADLVADEYGVYVASADTTLYVLDRTNGKIRWRYMAQQPLEAAPFVTADRVYQIVPEVGLVALDKLQGKLFREPLWTSAGVRQILSADNRRVYVLTEDGRALALDKQTGEIRYEADMSEYDLFATNRRDATVYAASKAGKLAAFKPTESRLK